MHKTHSYLLNPEHLITVALIGCGGTGSQVLTCLARLNDALIGIGHTGIHVTVYDGDDVDETNIGRQLYSSVDIGQNKASVSVSRVNRYFGLDWDAVPTNRSLVNKINTNITITCVDSIKTRKGIASLFHLNEKLNNEQKPYYWLDFGNDLKTGQVVLGSLHGKKMKTVTERFPQLLKMRDKKSQPSCSIAQALGKQDLFINSTLAQLGMNLLWKLFREGGVKYGGLYLNLDSLTVNPMPI